MTIGMRPSLIDRGELERVREAIKYARYDVVMDWLEAALKGEGSKLSFADELKLLDAGCDKVIDIMNNRATLSTPSMEDGDSVSAELAEALWSIVHNRQLDYEQRVDAIEERLAKYRERRDHRERKK